MSCRVPCMFSSLLLEKKKIVPNSESYVYFAIVLKYYVKNKKMSNCIQKIKFHSKGSETKT